MGISPGLLSTSPYGVIIYGLANRAFAILERISLMYTVDVKVKGVSPLLQHRFPMPDYETMGKGGHQQSGAKDYRDEWKQSLYVDADGDIFHPATHFERAMVKAAAQFKIQGKRGKTYKDLVSASVFVTPEEIPFNMKAPDELDTDADKPLYLDLRPVVIQRARVARIRPAFKPGWELEFQIEVIDDQMPIEMLHEILSYAGKAVGVGDYRPRFGRFQVVKFEVIK